MATGRSRDPKDGPTRAVELECDHCGGNYKRRLDRVRPGQPNYCSEECRAAASRVELECEVCGEGFTRHGCRAPGEEDHVYCSRHCAALAQRRRSTLLCPVCHEPFERSRWRVRSGPNYCSVQCSAVGRRRTVSVKCEVCGTIHDYPSKVARLRRFCSWDCYRAGVKRRPKVATDEPKL